MINIFNIILISLSQGYALRSTDFLKELSLTKSDVNIERVEVKDSEISDEDVLTRITLKRKAVFRGNSLVPGTLLVLSRNRGLSNIMPPRSKHFVILDGISCTGDVRFQNDKLCSCTIGAPFAVRPDLVIPIGSIVGFHDGNLELISLRTDKGPVQDSKGGKVSEVDGVKLRQGPYYLVKDGKLTENDPMPGGYCGG